MSGFRGPKRMAVVAQPTRSQNEDLEAELGLGRSALCAFNVLSRIAVSDGQRAAPDDLEGLSDEEEVEDTEEADGDGEDAKGSRLRSPVCLGGKAAAWPTPPAAVAIFAGISFIEYLGVQRALRAATEAKIDVGRPEASYVPCSDLHPSPHLPWGCSSLPSCRP